MARRKRKVKLQGPVAVLLALLSAVIVWLTAERRPPAGLPAQGIVSRVVDGDTVHVQADAADHTVRLIGVDTPECHESDKLERDAERTGQDKRTIQALGRRAGDFTRALCTGKSCRLEYDQADAARGHRDRYGRLLAYLFVAGDDGLEILVNAEIIRQGYGAAMTEFPFDDARQAEFLRLQRHARQNKRGLWGAWKP